MKATFSNAAKLLGASDPSWLLFRLWYAAQQRTGLLRLRMPHRSWASQPLASWIQPSVPAAPAAYAEWRNTHAANFFFKEAAGVPPEVRAWAATAVPEAEAVLGGPWRYFSHRTFEIGFPPDWHRNPLTQQQIPSDRHWSGIDVFGYGDIKLVWEASRFSVTYTLVRAYAATGDERYAAAFWRLVENWAERNPPQLGPNWYDGQEAALRSMAWCFGLNGFRGSAQSTPERISSLTSFLATHSRRIAANLSYSRAQKNNHVVSEGAALWTIGMLFPEFQRARAWRETGRAILEDEARRQIYSDGSYAMHSFNYHRLVLHDYLWSMRLGELNDCRLSDFLYERMERAVGFLSQFVDPQTGCVPNYGGNDGALILPLNGCDYGDFRPALQAMHYLLHQAHLYPPGPWDEDLYWLFGRETASTKEGMAQPARSENIGASASKQRHGPADLRGPGTLGAPEGGYHLLRGEKSMGVTRCAILRDRPSHSDQLHFDLWWRGENIACDAGTYLYNGEPPWDNGLAETFVHNTVTVDGKSQATRWGRFFWVDWAQGRVNFRRTSEGQALELWEGQHDGYARGGATHRRAVLRVGDDAWVVVDDVFGSGRHTAFLQWLLPDLPFQFDEKAMRLTVPAAQGTFAAQIGSVPSGELSLVRGGVSVTGTNPGYQGSGRRDELRGWRSRYYADKEPALSLGLDVEGTLPLRFVTLFGVPPLAATVLQVLSLEGQSGTGRLKVELARPGVSPVILSAQWVQGERIDRIVAGDPQAINFLQQ